jgi:GNAT superfamily N-acetyltransferase
MRVQSTGDVGQRRPVSSEISLGVDRHPEWVRDDASRRQTPLRGTVSLLADRPDAVGAVAQMRWREWGHAPEPEDPAWWHDLCIREAGREQLPVTFVAHSATDEVLGAVGLDTYDLDERRDTSPWITGMIVRRDHRGKGIGRTLMHHLERWAAEHSIAEGWVGTDLARGFYERCGWMPLETFTSTYGQEMTVLHKKLF